MAHLFNSKLLNRADVGLATLQPCPFAGVVTPDQVKVAQGELLDIWPQSISPMMNVAGLIVFSIASGFAALFYRSVVTRLLVAWDT
jgi:hypothetical protein